MWEPGADHNIFDYEKRLLFCSSKCQRLYKNRAECVDCLWDYMTKNKFDMIRIYSRFMRRILRFCSIQCCDLGLEAIEYERGLSEANQQPIVAKPFAVFEYLAMSSDGVSIFDDGKMTQIDILPSKNPPANYEANTMALNLDIGLRAWKQWKKNYESDEQDICQLSAKKCCEKLKMLVNTIRKPNGLEYAPDTIYYIALGLEKHLRNNKIFWDILLSPSFASFNVALDQKISSFFESSTDSREFSGHSEFNSIR